MPKRMVRRGGGERERERRRKEEEGLNKETKNSLKNMPRRRERKEENRRQNGTYIIYTVTVGRRVCHPQPHFLFARNRSFVCTAGLPLVLGLRQRAATPRLYPRFPSVPGRRQGWRPPLNVHNRCNHWHCLSLQLTDSLPPSSFLL